MMRLLVSSLLENTINLGVYTCSIYLQQFYNEDWKITKHPQWNNSVAQMTIREMFQAMILTLKVIPIMMLMQIKGKAYFFFRMKKILLTIISSIFPTFWKTIGCYLLAQSTIILTRIFSLLPYFHFLFLVGSKWVPIMLITFPFMWISEWLTSKGYCLLFWRW